MDGALPIEAKNRSSIVACRLAAISPCKLCACPMWVLSPPPHLPEFLWASTFEHEEPCGNFAVDGCCAWLDTVLKFNDRSSWH